MNYQRAYLIYGGGEIYRVICGPRGLIWMLPEN